MTWTLDESWKPTKLREVADSYDTSTGTTEVMTDAGPAYLKPLGNRQGPHVLATDWVGTHLAKWFGLSTFKIAIFVLQEDDVFPLPRGAEAAPGPAFASQAMKGEPWDKSEETLDCLVNPEDITRLVIFDTWTLNCDRHHPAPNARKPNYDNVYLSSEGVKQGQRRLIAMDHGLCFIRSGEDLTTRLSDIDKVQDKEIYGLFPEFRSKLQQPIIDSCADRLREMRPDTAREIVATVPREWDVPEVVRVEWANLISRRATFVADTIRESIDSAVPWFGKKGE